LLERFLCEAWGWLTPIAKTCCLLSAFYVQLFMFCLTVYTHYSYKASHSQRMWVKELSFVAHLLFKGILVSPSNWRCLLKVLCPVRRPTTTLDCVLLRDESLVFVAQLGPKFNYQTCQWVLLRTHHLAKYNCPQWNAASDFPLYSVHHAVSFPHQYKHLWTSEDKIFSCWNHC
jgi:hypothetical protein